jgi:hypothetical protein
MLVAILGIVLAVVLAAVGLMVRSSILKLRSEIAELRTRTQQLAKRLEVAEQSKRAHPAASAASLLPALITPLVGARVKKSNWGMMASAGMLAFRLISSYMQRRRANRRAQ